MSTSSADVNLLASLRKQIEAISPVLPDKAVVTVGQYMLETFIDSPRFSEEDLYTLIRVIHKKDLQHKPVKLDPENSLMMDTVYEPHYWFDLNEYLDNVDLNNVLEKLVYDYHKEILSLTNLSEGASAGILPHIHRFLSTKEKSTLAVSVFPSMSHSSDALFNSFSSVGMILLDESTSNLIIDQGKLEEYKGVHRKGDSLEGIDIIDYLVELLLDKEGFIRDIYKLSKSYDVRVYSPLLASGCSLDIYENFRNILQITLEQPLMSFDITTASMLYVLVRAPMSYRDEFQKGHLELEVSQWMQESLGLDIPQICEPVFVEEFGDRIDVAILVGGYDTGNMFEEVYHRIERFSNMNVEQGLVQEETWRKIKEIMLS